MSQDILSLTAEWSDLWSLGHSARQSNGSEIAVTLGNGLDGLAFPY
jgi:hypothetical protein